MKAKIEGLVAAPFTPMNDDGSVNLAGIDAYAEFLEHNGVCGAFVNGTTGEGLSLTPHERMEAAERWANVASKRLKVIIHVGHDSIEMCRALAGHAQEIGAWGIGSLGPIFFKPRRSEDLVEFCREVAAAAPDLPFYYYHIPSMTGIAISMFDFLKAAADEIPNLAGVKFTYEDLMDFRLCLELDSGRFDMLFGRDEILLSALVLGARGAVGSTYNFAAPLYTQLITAFDEGELSTAQSLQHRSAEMIQLLINTEGGFLPAAKSVMKMVGMDCGPVRLPLRRMGPNQFCALQTGLEKTGFFEYCSKAS